MRTITPIMMIFVAAAAFGQSASAREFNDINRTFIRQEFAASNFIRVAGSLICDNASGNTACQINLKDNKTGEIYQLSQTDRALELLNAGTKAVMVEGRVTNGKIAVNKISAL